MKTKIRQTSFSPRGNILGLIDAAQLQRRSTDAVMIPGRRRFNPTFWDTPTLRSYSVGVLTL
jgi:hypothetical protein